ncbi:MAG: TIGR03617 family F420-dependent LLM class oxidoreductase [Myxococcota bacterium]
MKVYATMEPNLALRDVPSHAQRAERLGYTGLAVPEALHDGFLTSLLALEHTHTLRVATSIALAFPRSPMTTAYAAWDLQSLSGGRFELGLGSQVKGNMERRYSVEWKPPVPRMREYLGALRAIWDCWQNGTQLDFRGEHYRIDRMQPFFNPGPIEHPDIPLYLGGVNAAMTRLAGEAADGIVTHPTNTSPRTLRELTLPNIEIGAKKAGKTRDRVEIIAGGFVATGATAEAVAAERERIREYLGFLYSTPQYWRTLELHGWRDLGERLRGLARAGRWGEMKAAVGDEVLDALVPAGPYDEIADVLKDWYGDLATGLSFRMPEDLGDDDRAAAVIERLRS